MVLNLMRLTYALLMFVGVGGLFWIAPADIHVVATMIWAFILYFPLALMFPAFINGNKRLVTWMCFVLMFYFMGYSIQIFNEPPIRTLGLLKTTLTTVLFVLAVVQLRQSPHDGR